MILQLLTSNNCKVRKYLRINVKSLFNKQVLSLSMVFKIMMHLVIGDLNNEEI